jgi:phage head maturation protease
MTELLGLALAGPNSMFVPFMKVNEEQHMVFGYASTEKRDVQGEIVRLDAIERALPDYMRFANIREMHQPSAVGIAKEANVDRKGLYVGAHVVDDRAWTKCKAGVYKGFSIGGKVTARDPDDKSVITGLNLTEISLVDRPANPEAIYTVVKFDDGVALPMPLQKWDCGVSDHQHFGKNEAIGCMRDRMEARAADVGRVLDELAKRSTHSVANGRLQSHAQAITEADRNVKFHEDEATRARTAQDRFKGRAAKAGDKADSLMLLMNEKAASGFAHLVAGHENLAHFHRSVADHHRSLATKPD